MTDPKTITITWVETTLEAIPGARTDLGERPTLREVNTARSCVWLLEGTDDDEARARAYAESSGALVHTFDPHHPDPLASARALALELRKTKP